jgi:L-asparaginase II
MTDPVVAEVSRNGFVESVHHGRLAVLGPDGGLVAALGDVDAPMFPRSSLKPLQVAGLLAAGWQPADPAHLALAAASHSGEPRHVDGVRRILAAAGLDDSALANTPDLPLDQRAACQLLAAGGGPDRLHQNCSGKHAAMLAACVAAGWPVAGYLDPTHPVQQAVRATVERLCGERVAAVAVDGCGAPLFAVSLIGLARGVYGLVDSPVAVAMRAHPDLVGGTGRDVTDLMSSIPGLLAKDGAEGVYVAAMAAHGVVAAKIMDGAARARLPLVLRGLALLGISTDAVQHLVPPVLGHGEPVGSITAVDPRNPGGGGGVRSGG